LPTPRQQLGVYSPLLQDLANKEAKKYGMKVVRMEDGATGQSGHHISHKNIEAERKLFRAKIGKQAHFAADKDGLKEAIAEATHHALSAKIKKVKAKVNASLAKEDKRAKRLCAMSKRRIMQLKGKANAANRAMELETAIHVCHIAKAAVAHERAMDYKEIKAMGQEENRYIQKHPVHVSRATTKKKLSQHTGQKGTHAAKNVATDQERSMHAKAAQLCRVMTKKVKHLGRVKRTQAAAFCKKAKALVEKEMEVDRRTLERMALQHGDRSSKKTKEKAEAETFTEVRMKSAAKRALAERKKHPIKPISKGEKQRLLKSHAGQTILKNLRTMRHYTTIIDMALTELEEASSQSELGNEDHENDNDEVSEDDEIN